MTTWSNRDKALLDVASGVRRAIENLESYRAAAATKKAPSPLGAEAPSPDPSAGEPSIEMGLVLERVFRRNVFASVEWMRVGLMQATAVARIESTRGPVGTGFLVDSDDFAHGILAKQLLLTCSYVVGPAGDADVEPSDAVAFFELLGLRRTLGTVVWSSPPSALGVSLITLTESVDVAPCRVSLDRDLTDGIDPEIFLIGHPLGGSLQFSIWNNELLTTKLRRAISTLPRGDGAWIKRQPDF